MKKLSPPQWLAVGCAIITILSLINVYDFKVWVFEIWVGFAAVLVLNLTHKRFPFSNLVYWLVGIHFAVLALGAHYTYAEMPLFNWLRDAFDLSRNHYDRVGHFMQGFVPVIVAREIFIRNTKIMKGKMLGFISIIVCLGMSALWEVLEMVMVLLFYKEEGMAWLGTQGDSFDPVWDMTMAVMGAILAYALLRKLHDSSIAKLTSRRQAR